MSSPEEVTRQMQATYPPIQQHNTQILFEIHHLHQQCPILTKYCCLSSPSNSDQEEGAKTLETVCKSLIARTNEDQEEHNCIKSAEIRICFSIIATKQNKLSQLGLGWAVVEVRSSDAALHHSPSRSNSSFIV